MDSIYIIAYGSLINKNQLKQYDFEILSYTPISVEGFKREFSQEPSFRDASSINRAVLTIKEQKDCFINAVLIELQNSSLKQIDKREKGYNRLSVNKNQINFKYINTTLALENKEIYIYLGKEEKYNNTILPNLEYLDICLEGATSWGEKFNDDFLDSTFIQDEALKSFIKTIYK